MFQGSKGKTMKWASLLKEIKEKVGLPQSSSSTAATTVSPPSSSTSPPPPPPPSADRVAIANASSTRYDFAPSLSSRDKHELELDFNRFWEDFCSSNSEKEKEMALSLTVDAFCRLVKLHADVAQLVTQLVETHIFSFVVGRAFVTDIEKLKISSKIRSLDVSKVLQFFSEVPKDGISIGSNLLTAVEVLVSGPFDKQALLDSGMFCCLIQILNSLLNHDEANQKQKITNSEESLLAEKDPVADFGHACRVEVEGSIVHIMKTLASHPSAAQSLTEDDSLRLLFQIVANGSLTAFSRYKEGLVSLHIIQLYKHAMQILGLLLVNDNGSTTQYIHTHHLIKVLLVAVKDFNPDCGDPAYTVGIVDLLLECVELSYRQEAGDLSLREDMRNAHGYHFLVQFALVLSSIPQNQGIESIYLKHQADKECGSDSAQPFDDAWEKDFIGKEDPSSEHVSPTLSRLLDILVNLAQTGPADGKRSKYFHTKASGNSRSQTLSTDSLGNEIWEQGNNKVKDLEAVLMLQDIFLKADSRDLQAEVLNRMFKIFSSHLENYKLCQQVRTVPLLILNMAGFPSSLQEKILKILEYAVTVVNCVPEQELLSLCFLLQQPITSELKLTILSFFVKLLSFDQQYKKVLREVGVLEVLLDGLKQHKFLLGQNQHDGNANQLDGKSSSSSFKKHLNSDGVIITAPKFEESGSGKFPIFETEETIAIAWDCMVSLVKDAEASRASFRSANGVTIVLPFLVSNVHRPGVLRTLSCLITEDAVQGHPEDLAVLIEVLKSGMVTSVSGRQYKLQSDAKCDTMGALWRILGVNSAAQRVFGEASGFSLLLTTVHSFQGHEGRSKESSLLDCIKEFTYLSRLMTAAVCGNAINRTKLHAIISSQTFYDLLSESRLLCVDYEKQVIQLLLELALEITLPPFITPESASLADMAENKFTSFPLTTQSGLANPDKERVYNAGAVRVLIRSVLLFTPKVQLEVLNLIEKLARSGTFNLENLTSVGCVELVLETIHPFLPGSSPLLSHALKIIEVLGAYRLSASELRALARHILQTRLIKSGHTIVDMMDRLILMEDMGVKTVSLAPFVEMEMSKVGHGSFQVSLGERSWPPAAGYSFVCWFQFKNFLKTQTKETEPAKSGLSKKKTGLNGQHHDQQVLWIFSVGAVNSDNTFYAELYLQEDGVLTLATGNSCSLSFSGLELEEGQWHHLAIVHSKPNALAGLFQASIAYVYLDGKLMRTGKLGYSLSPMGKPLQVTIGTPVTAARVSDLTWRLRSCYLFEEVLTPGCICFMYILGRGYRGLFQDADLLRFVPYQACGGGSMAILDSFDADLSVTPGTQKFDGANKQGDSKADGSGIVWDLHRLGRLSFQLSGKKLIFAFDGTCTEAVRASGTTSYLLNLVDPLSAAASPIGGIPRFGRPHGDIYICRQCVIGDTIRSVGGMSVILALVEAAETREMLHMALSFLSCALHHNPQNIKDMQTYRGYHLLALFLRQRMSSFDMQCLEIFLQIAACEASFSEPSKLECIQTFAPPTEIIHESSFEDLSFSKFRDRISGGTQFDMDDFSSLKDSFSHTSELENADMPAETSNCIVLSNAAMVEHVLLDWTLWVTAPVPIQIALLNFLEQLVSVHWYRNHNLTVLRQINLVQHLLVTLQRGDVEVPVLEKLVAVLGVILEDGFASELEKVVKFVIMSFDPPEMKPLQQITREPMGKHVIVRNLLLEMLMDLQVSIKSEEMLEQLHKMVSSKLVTSFLDEAVHPTSMRWIMTILGVRLASSPAFALKFRTTGGYQGLMRVLPSFYDSPDIYYILFCLVFGKPVYPRLPEVRMLDFHALMPSDGGHVELKFVELLESIIAMAKSTFDRLSTQAILACQTGNFFQIVAELVEENADMTEELQGEALMHKTYAARLMGGDASAPAATTSVLRFMVDLAKTCPTFSAVCRRAEFLECCVDLYFSCVRSGQTVKMARESSKKSEEKNLNDCDDASSQNSPSIFPVEQEQSARTSISAGSFHQAQISSTSEEMLPSNFCAEDKEEMKPTKSEEELNKTFQEDVQVNQSLDGDSVNQVFSTSSTNEVNHNNIKDNQAIQPPDPQSSVSVSSPDSYISSEKLNSTIPLTPSPSPFIASTPWLSSASNLTEFKNLMESSMSTGYIDQSFDLKSGSLDPNSTNTTVSVIPKLLLEMDDSGYGGGPCSAGAAAMLDFIAEVLADASTEQIRAAQFVEGILEMVPLYVGAESMLVFQGLFLSRLMNFIERRLLHDDEEDVKKLDKIKWSSNLDALCWMIVDRVYMGAFPQPAGVLRTLEFLLSMLQLANKDGRIEETAPTGKGLLSITRGTRQLEAYVHSILKNTNRMILYCFLPPFLFTIGEEDLLCSLGLLTEPKKRSPTYSSEEDQGIDICKVLQLLFAHRRLIFCPINLDIDLNCCLCVNLICLIRDQRQNVQNLAIDVVKYLLVHRKAYLEDLLVSKPNKGQRLDVLHGGFDKLLTGNLSAFFDWLWTSEEMVKKVLEQCAAIMWLQYISGSTKFPGVRIKGMEGRRKREMGRKSRDTAKVELKHREQMNERRCAMDGLRHTMSTELRVVRQDKYGWVLHAESEWQTHLQQIVNERGIFPIRKPSSSKDPEWQLCPIEGPYRMRKKLECCKVRINSIQNVLDGQLELGDMELPKVKHEDGPDVSDPDSKAIFNLLNDIELFDESLYKGPDDMKDVTSVKNGWIDDKASSVTDGSLHSALEVSAKSSAVSLPISISIPGRSEIESPRLSPSIRMDEVKVTEDKLDKEQQNNREYLIRPYLEPLEKIRFRYNCERVVGLDKHDGIFLIGQRCLYVIENFYIDDSGCICEKESEDELSVIDQALGVKKDVTGSMDCQSKSTSSWDTTPKTLVGGRTWAYNGGAWGKEKVVATGNLPHPWRMWRLVSIYEILKRDYQLRPVAIELFSMDGYNDLLVFHKRERDEVFKNLVAVNLPRNSMLETTISGSTKQEINEGSRLFRITAKSFSKRWQTGEISNFQYLMHLNTLAGRGYSDLTQYPVFPWILANYESENLDLSDPKTFRKLEKPMGCQTPEGEEEFKTRYESWDDPEVPKFHYGSHYSSAGIVLFYLLRLPPFSAENQKLQGGQFDHADRLFSSIRDTWLSAAGKGNTSDVKELIPEFFYMPEFLENSFSLDLGEKQSGEKVGDVHLPLWAKGSAREFIRMHREALESNFVSENLHNWIDLIFGYKQRGKAAEKAANVFYHYTYEGSVDIDAVTDPSMKASILAQINHFGQTPKQLFLKPHVKRRTDRKLPPHPLKKSTLLVPHELRKASYSITQIVSFQEKILIGKANTKLKPRMYSKYVAWGFPDLSLRFLSFDYDRLLSTHENLHLGNQTQCAGFSHDGHVLVTGADDGLVYVWRISEDNPRGSSRLLLEKVLCAHRSKITCLHVSQSYMLIASGSDDCTVIIWDLSSLRFVRQLPEFPAPVSAVYVNELTGEIMTAAGTLLAVWSINGCCLAVISTSQVPSDYILSATSSTFSDWLDTNWYVTGHHDGAVKVWHMVHCTDIETISNSTSIGTTGGLPLDKSPEYRLLLHKVLTSHKHPVTSLLLTTDLKQLLSGDSGGQLLSWTLPP
ncbi:SPIRRIG, Beach-Domain Homolog A1 [Hibiscus trionum]|uniref:SPIRRIG, Beach-Domain Homolog A1 n=1 Tax=Hibiscus trionum TaxID=183268 RepID=A0A9W7LUX2_HIBTR|nr:SPIRRIG, Beach-Domain Homolog A1 [Hibiscus trionum]